MGELMHNFLYEEDGMGTVEMVMIICVLVGIALVFGNAVKGALPAKITEIFDNIKV